jgi:hypothetical protein
MVLEEVVTEFVACHEAKLVGLEGFEQRRRKQQEKSPLLGSHRGGIEHRLWIDVDLERRLDPEDLPALVQHVVNVAGHLPGEASGGGQELATGAGIGPEALDGRLDVELGEQPLGELAVPFGTEIATRHVSECSMPPNVSMLHPRRPQSGRNWPVVEIRAHEPRPEHPGVGGWAFDTGRARTRNLSVLGDRALSRPKRGLESRWSHHRSSCCPLPFADLRNSMTNEIWERYCGR